jgi:protein-S-isoprenylcysteine O-methyltransferase
MPLTRRSVYCTVQAKRHGEGSMSQGILIVVMALFPISEIALALLRHSREGSARRGDRGSMRLLWITIFVGLALANAAAFVPMARLPIPASVARSMSLALLLFGLGIRWTAILTLGRFFTVDVAIRSDHAIVQHGLYRYVRHPSYTGLLIAFLGLGMVSANWLSIVVLLVPITLGVLHRVAVEERALLESLGSSYADYCVRTKRFVPGLL